MYSEIVKKSFNLWWKNKILWIVGFLATLTFYTTSERNLTDLINRHGNSYAASQFTIFLGISIFLTWIIILIYTLSIGLFANNGQILAYRDLYEGKKIGSIKEIVKSGIKYWGKYILLSLAFITPIILVLIVFGIIVALVLTASGIGLSGLFEGGALAGMSIVLILSFCCLFFVFLIVGIALMTHFYFAERVLILENKGVIDSIKISFGIIKRNLGKIVMALLVELGIGILAAMIIFIPLFIVNFIGGILSVQVQEIIVNIGLSLPLLGALIYILYSIISVVLTGIYSGIMGSFTQSYWNVVYLEIRMAENHLVNGEPEKENLGQVKSVSKPVESQVQN